MAKTDWDYACLINQVYPNAFYHLQELVMSMADCQNNVGKKTLVGKDKGLKCFIKFQERLKDTLLALEEDGFIKDRNDPSGCSIALLNAIEYFSIAFPNWQDAYSFFSYFFIEEEDLGIELIKGIWE